MYEQFLMLIVFENFRHMSQNPGPSSAQMENNMFMFMRNKSELKFRRLMQITLTVFQEESDRVKAEVAAALQASAMRFEPNFSQSHSDVMFSLDDFEGKFETYFCVS